MGIGDDALTCATGPAVDLLLWMPKKAVAMGTGDMRPLQLPPCFRRLIGAALAGIVGPIVEPHLSPRQAAIRGGYCGPNVSLTLPELIAGRLPEVLELGMACWAEFPPRYGSMLAPSLTRSWLMSRRWSLRISPKPLSAGLTLGLWRC